MAKLAVSQSAPIKPAKPAVKGGKGAPSPFPLDVKKDAKGHTPVPKKASPPKAHPAAAIVKASPPPTAPKRRFLPSASVVKAPHAGAREEAIKALVSYGVAPSPSDERPELHGTLFRGSVFTLRGGLQIERSGASVEYLVMIPDDAGPAALGRVSLYWGKAYDPLPLDKLRTDAKARHHWRHAAEIDLTELASIASGAIVAV